jgi:imidazole glycerol-phosphate synthase subunit HisH
MITIVDYGLGNIRAFENVYKRLNIETNLAKSVSDLTNSTNIILPGVGSFDHAMKLLNGSGMRDALDRLVLDRKVPVIGICLGMQIMGTYSEEGKLPGLGWIDGNAKLFNADTMTSTTQYPHMGWNSIKANREDKIFTDLDTEPRFYFLHSYYFECQNRYDSIAKTTYGIEYTSVFNHENVYGIQCHPEKSHSNGVQLLKNFSQLNTMND